jgi:hypothetical protein
MKIYIDISKEIYRNVERKESEEKILKKLRKMFAERKKNFAELNVKL